MSAERRSRSTEAFFGRRRGKTIRPLKAGALAELLPQYGIDLTLPAPQPLTSLFQATVTEVRLEIGFGSGEHLLYRARTEPGVGFIGVEPFVNGMAHLMQELGEEPLANLRVYGDDATRVLDWLPASALAEIDLFYPDPWTKRRHWKRRFVSPVNLDRFARVLKPGGLFRFASDIDTYLRWTLQACAEHAAFDLAGAHADHATPYPGWPGTRYEAKAIREGRKPAYLTFVRK
jgi:tRNA (guanine-N7-)-methyltransferase